MDNQKKSSHLSHKSTKKRKAGLRSSIRIKITFWAGLALVLVSIVLIGYSVNTLRQTTIDNSTKEAIAIAEAKTGLIQNQLDAPRLSARTLAQSFGAIKDQALQTSLSRDAANGMLRKVLISNPSFLGTYTLWEPNAFDGLDAEYVRAVAHDDTGRFIPFWVRDASGIIHTEALVQYEMPGVGDWYILPRSTLKGVTIAPVINQIQEQEVVTASFIEPILHDNQFYGVAGVDAPIGFVQQLVDSIDMYDGTTNAVLFTDDGTLIAARQHPEMVNQPADLIFPDFESFRGQLNTSLTRLSPDGKYLQIFSPLDVSEGATRWVLGLIIPFEEITALATTAAIRQVAISTIIIILSLVFLWLMAGQLVRPLRELTNAAEFVASGRLDVVADIHSNDEAEVLADAFNTMTARLREILVDLEQRVTNRTRDLKLAAEVGQRLSLVRETNLMLTDAVEIIGERFDLYYTQVYLTDPTGRSLVLRAGTGEAGQTLLRRGHRLPVDMSSLNGIAASERRAVIVIDTETSPLHRPNPLLPDTRSEMVVPLLVAERVVGVLDMQSTQPGALSEENLPAFETLAGQLAISIANAELFEETERARNLVEEQTRRLTGEGWHNFMDALERRERIAYTFDREKITPFDVPLLGAMDDSTLVTPIRVSGEQVGTFQFERETSWTTDDQMIVDTVAQQVAQQIENLRLLAQSEQYQAEAQEALQRLTREGWEQYQKQIVDTQLGFVYRDFEVKALDGTETEPEIAVTVPITVRNETIGQWEILDTGTLSKEDAELVKYINEQLSTHLENIRLTTQTEQALARTDELYGISQAMNEANSEAAIIEALARPARANGAFSAILMYLESDHTGDLDSAKIVADWRVEGAPPNPIGTRFFLNEMPRMKSWLSQPEDLWLISDIRTDERLDDAIRNLMIYGGSYSVAAIPLTRGREKVGVLLFNWHQSHEFSPLESETYQAIIGLASPAVQSRRLYEQAQTRSKELDILNEMGRTLTNLQDEQGIYQTIYDYTGRLMGVEKFFVSAYNEEKHEIAFPIFYELGERVTTPNQTVGNGLVSHVIKTRQPLLISSDFQTQTKELGIESDSIGHDDPSVSWLGVPLVFKDRIIGVVSVQSATTPGLYTKRELDLLTAIASQASVAIENAVAFQHTQKQAEHEATINLISQRIQSTTSVENALQVAIRELGRALGAKRTNVQLGLPSEKKPGN